MHIIISERTKCIKFEEGLRFGIKDHINTDDMQSFIRLWAIAIRAEELEREQMLITPEEDMGSKGGSEWRKRKGNPQTQPTGTRA